MAGKSRVKGIDPSADATVATVESKVSEALRLLEERSTPHDLANLLRFGIAAKNAIGVSMANIQGIAKTLGKNHEIAAGLWDTGCYEAQMMSAYVDEVAKVSSEQMESWCRDFDNWGITDTVCFVLFDKTPYAWQKVEEWSRDGNEFVKRAAFALLWGLSVHDRQSDDKKFIKGLRLIEMGATDERHFVKKAVNMALRAVGKRNVSVNVAAVAVARKLSSSKEATPKWIGKDALRELTSSSVVDRLARKARREF